MKYSVGCVLVWYFIEELEHEDFDVPGDAQSNFLWSLKDNFICSQVSAKTTSRKERN